MIYLQWCCFCVDLRVGTFIIGGSDFFMDLIFGILIAIFGESGEPDLAHKLFCIFMLAHLASTLMLILGALWLKPNYMLCYILLTLIKILAMVILVISDVILVIWAPIISFYIVMFFFGAYYWLVVYSFYAALGGNLFI